METQEENVTSKGILIGITVCTKRSVFEIQSPESLQVYERLISTFKLI